MPEYRHDSNIMASNARRYSTTKKSRILADFVEIKILKDFLEKKKKLSKKRKKFSRRKKNKRK